jgi:hypothetical protein
VNLGLEILLLYLLVLLIVKLNYVTSFSSLNGLLLQAGKVGIFYSSNGRIKMTDTSTIVILIISKQSPYIGVQSPFRGWGIIYGSSCII